MFRDRDLLEHILVGRLWKDNCRTCLLMQGCLTCWPLFGMNPVQFPRRHSAHCVFELLSEAFMRLRWRAQPKTWLEGEN